MRRKTLMCKSARLTRHQHVIWNWHANFIQPSASGTRQPHVVFFLVDIATDQGIQTVNAQTRRRNTSTKRNATRNWINSRWSPDERDFRRRLAQTRKTPFLSLISLPVVELRLTNDETAAVS